MSFSYQTHPISRLLHLLRPPLYKHDALLLFGRVGCYCPFRQLRNFGGVIYRRLCFYEVFFPPHLLTPKGHCWHSLQFSERRNPGGCKQGRLLDQVLPVCSTQVLGTEQPAQSVQSIFKYDRPLLFTSDNVNLVKIKNEYYKLMINFHRREINLFYINIFNSNLHVYTSIGFHFHNRIL